MIMMLLFLSVMRNHKIQTSFKTMTTTMATRKTRMTTKTKPAAKLAVCSRRLVWVLQVGPTTELSSTPVEGRVAIIGCNDGSDVDIPSVIALPIRYDTTRRVTSTERRHMKMSQFLPNFVQMYQF